MPLPLTLRLSPRTPLQPCSFSVSGLLSPFQNPNSKNLKSTTIRWLNQYQNQNQNQNQRGRGTGRRRGRGICICRAEISQDAPFAVAIGACMLSSLLIPSKQQQQEEEEEEDDDAAITPTDARFTVMTIISFIPYFNWLSWIFAWMDTGNSRFAVYAAVYLAPYVRTNLSLSLEESWLPIASVVLGIIHVQLEASIRSGDMDRFTFFSDVAKRLGLIGGSKDDHYTKQRMHEERRFNNINLPSGKAQLGDEIRKWRVPRKPSPDVEHDDVDDKMDH